MVARTASIHRPRNNTGSPYPADTQGPGPDQVISRKSGPASQHLYTGAGAYSLPGLLGIHEYFFLFWSDRILFPGKALCQGKSSDLILISIGNCLSRENRETSCNGFSLPGLMACDPGRPGF